MPSYKEKYLTVSNKLDSMERRILIDESILLLLKEEVEQLSRSKEEKNDVPSSYMQNQMILALNEIEDLCFGTKRTTLNPALQNADELYEKIINSLHSISKMLRDSHVRAKTLTDVIKRKNDTRPRTPPSRPLMPHQRVESNSSNVAASPVRNVAQSTVPGKEKDVHQVRSSPK